MKSAENFYVSLGLPAPARLVLEEVGSLSGAGRLGAQEEQPRVGVAHRSRRRRALADERRARRAVVRDRAPRARPHLLLHLVQHAGGADAAARGRQPRVSRGGRRAGQAGEPADAVPGQGGRDAAREGAGRHGLAAAVGDGVDRVHAVLRRHHEPLRARPLRGQFAAVGVAEASGGTTPPSTRGSSRRSRAPTTRSATRARRRTSTTTPPSTTTTRWRA